MFYAFNFIITLIDEDLTQIVNIWMLVLIETFDIINYSFLLYVYRPRKEWPEFYSLDIGDMVQNYIRANNAVQGNDPEA